MRRAATVTALVVMALGTGAVFVPFLAERGERLTGTPVPEPRYTRSSQLDLEPGAVMCLDSVALTPDTGRVRVWVATGGVPGPPLALELAGERYRALARVRDGYPDGSRLDFRVEPPEREVLAEACVTNHGRSAVSFEATDGRYETARPATTLDGTPTRTEPALLLLEEGEAPLAERLPEMMRRTALFHPLGTWAAWLMLALVLGCVFVLPLRALRLSPGWDDLDVGGAPAPEAEDRQEQGARQDL